MQDRLQRFLEDRTQMLAAISHDLRAPLARLRFRAELVTDGEQQRKMFDDLDVMNAMIDSTLAFARDDSRQEPRRLVGTELSRGSRSFANPIASRLSSMTTGRVSRWRSRRRFLHRSIAWTPRAIRARRVSALVLASRARSHVNMAETLRSPTATAVD